MPPTETSREPLRVPTLAVARRRKRLSLSPRPLLLATALALLFSAPAVGSAEPKARSVLGGAVAAATDAPWAVFIFADLGGGRSSSCTGSLISATEVLTAAHCAQADPGSYSVYAGWDRAPDGQSGYKYDQVRTLRAVRVHPGYVRAPVNDVAVLELTTPFDLGLRVAPIVVADSFPPPTVGLRLYGYGSPNTGELRGIAVTLAERWACSDTALFVCGSSPDGSACPGDSGGGVVTAQTPPVLVAVHSVGASPCQVSGYNGHADVTAPEVRRFVNGEGSPPISPRIIGSVPSLRATAFPDGAVHCDPGSWSGDPAANFTFSDANNGAVLADGPASAYHPVSTDAGRSIRCVASMTNAGGTAQVSPDPLTVPTPWKLTVTNGTIRAQLFEAVAGRQAAIAFNDVRGREAQRVAITSFDELWPVMVPELPVGRYTACLELTPVHRFTAWRECAGPVTVNDDAASLVHRVRSRRAGARFTVELRTSAPMIGRRVTATWSTARCRDCPGVRLARKEVRLSARLALRSPAVARGRELRLRLKLPAIRVDGGLYTSGRADYRAGRRPKRG
jgi:hypothetical protein